MSATACNSGSISAAANLLPVSEIFAEDPIACFPRSKHSWASVVWKSPAFNSISKVPALEDVEITYGSTSPNAGFAGSKGPTTENGKLCSSYNENEAAKYMKEEKIDLLVNLNLGKKEFSAYTMDFTKKYIEINSDYRT